MKRLWREKLQRPNGAVAVISMVVVLAVTLVSVLAYPPSGRPATINAVWPPLWVVAGLLVWQRRPGHVAGPALVFYGLWIAVFKLLGAIEQPIPYTLNLLFGEWQSPLLIWAVLAFPSGAMTRVAWALVITRAVNAVLVRQLDHPFLEPRRWNCFECPEGSNLVLIRDDPDLVITLDDIGIGLFAVECVLLIAVLGWRLWRATPPARRVLAPVHAPMMVLMGGLLGTVVNILLMDLAGKKSWSPATVETFQTTAALTQVWLPLGILLGFRLEARRRARVAEMLEADAGSSLLEGIRRTLGDSSAQLVPGGAPPEPIPGLNATPLLHAGRQVGTLLHDPAAADDPRLMHGVTATAALALANQALAEELTAAVAEVRESQGRLMLAGEDARRRLERNLSHGAEARLRDAIEATRQAGDAADPGLHPALGALRDSLERTLDDVRALAQGLTPPVVAERGLAGAVEELAAASPVAVKIEALPSEPVSPASAETAFYVVSEGLTNVAKHARATAIVVRLEVEGDRLLVEVRDDGRGGADPASSGLRGLADRVALAGGTLAVDSPPGAGTRLTADLPVGIAAPGGEVIR